MCDYSLMHLKSRPAKVGDKLVTKNFGSGTSGFCSPDEPDTAVCVLPGTEIAFDKPITGRCTTLIGMQRFEHNLARFRQINKDNPHAHHDALEMGDGTFVLLTGLEDGQTATVLQLPAAPKTVAEVIEQKRVPVAG